MNAIKLYAEMRSIEEAFSEDKDIERLANSLRSVKPFFILLGSGISGISEDYKKACELYNNLLPDAVEFLDGKELSFFVV